MKLKGAPAIVVINVARAKSEADLSVFLFFFSCWEGFKRQTFYCTEPVWLCPVNEFSVPVFLTGLVDTSACCHTNADLIGNMNVPVHFKHLDRLQG